VHPLAFRQQAAGHDLPREDAIGIATFPKPAERADLKDAAGPLFRVGNDPSFADEAGHRFFAEDVFPRFHRGDGNERVPVRRRADGDAVDILAVEDVAEVGVPGLVVG
jgi:hypothetical protein